MRAKRNIRNIRKAIIFGNCKEVLQTVIMIYFVANLVFGEVESEFCKRGWSEFVKVRKQWERECLNEDDIKTSSCCKQTFDYLEDEYEDYIKFCYIEGKLCFNDREYLVHYLWKFCISLLSGIEQEIILDSIIIDLLRAIRYTVSHFWPSLEQSVNDE